ncbi:hypothetical protein ACIRS1_05825 [Kitasatospora sp. NPDC101176]|uniref:hypothetical protein n=1 Tax=Kitasatospora sp. NPDC101176 TaxID=3364099 RepID=UPI0038217913
MRQNGINMPDPKADGSMQTGPGQFDKAAFQKAADACKQYLPDQGSAGSGTQAQNQDQQLKLAQCLRGEGLNVADPKPGEALGLPGNLGDPQTAKAMQKCGAGAGSGAGR